MFLPKTTTIANGIENREGEAGNRGLQRVFRRRLSGLLNALRMSAPFTIGAKGIENREGEAGNAGFCAFSDEA